MEKNQGSENQMCYNYCMQHEELTRKIIGCAMKVHSALGNGFQEVIYQRALAIELADCDLKFDREYEMDIFYKEQKAWNLKECIIIKNQANLLILKINVRTVVRRLLL